MLKSMTGYGNCEKLINGKKITVEIKAVNHRFCDYSIKLPRYCNFMEDRIRQTLTGKISRGKIDIYVSIENLDTADKRITVDLPLAKQYIDALKELNTQFGITDDITVSGVAQFTDIFKTERCEEENEALWLAVKDVLDTASDEFVSMRSREGERIEADLKARIEYMKSLTKDIDTRWYDCVEEYRTRLYNKIKESLESLPTASVDEARVVTEVAIFADRIAVDEELVRLTSHFDEFYNIVNAKEPAGRKLDFLIQEINREINTIGSKANDASVAKKVVEFKAELEKLREQVQNIE